MPTPNLVLMLLIGVVLGGVAGVVLRGRGGEFFVNMILGIVGASIGAFFPVMMGSTPFVDVRTPDYLVRALIGSFLLVLVAVIFRSAKPKKLR